MHRLKIFNSAAHEGDITKLEAAINSWLEDAQPVVRHMTQTSSAEQLVISFLYDEYRHGAQVHTASAAVPEAFERSLNDLGLDPADEEPTLLPDAELPY